MDSPSATWHPAKMPSNQDNQIPQSIENQPVATHDDKQTVENTVHSIPDTQIIKEESQHQPSSDGAFLDQFNSSAGDDGDSAWDLSGPTPTSAPEEDDAAESENEHDVDQSESGPTSKAAKHSSTMSFARTVSHTLSFNDDEDTEWNLHRTETDPFKFMPPNERTNSFPVVPQREDATEESADHISPPPSTQAQDIIQDLENETSHTDPVAQPESSDIPGESQVADDIGAAEDLSQQYVGGEIVGAEEEESDARFEEGLPLIPQNDQDISKTHDEPKASGLGDAFAEDDVAEGDDFFSQVTQGTQPEADSTFERTLHRKSTTMAMGDVLGAAREAKDLDSELPTPVEIATPKVSVTPDAPAHELVNGDSEHSAAQKTDDKPAVPDVDAKWAAAFDDDDDDFLLDSAVESKELDPADIFGSDDEGFLEETSEEAPAAPTMPTSQPTLTAQPSSASLNGRYAPGVQQFPPPSPNPYAPAPVVSQLQQSPHPSYIQPVTAPPPAMGAYGAPPKPPMPKAQSFADKSKGGYTSPYDLPMEVVKPKKRPSMQQLPRANLSNLAPPAGPPRSASMYAQSPATGTFPSGGSNASLSPPSSSHSNQHPPTTAQKPPPQLKAKSSFFEDLPMASRPRPGSRHSNPLSPPQQSPFGQFPQGPPQGPPHGPPLGSPALSASMPPPPLPQPHTPLAQEQAAGIAPLVVPERVNPYAQLQSQSLPRPSAPPVSSARYSPAPAHLPVTNGTVPPPAASRYSPAPPSVRSPSGGFPAAPPPVLAHLPRTSSPLAHSHFEVSHEKPMQSPNGESIPLTRSSSSQHELRQTRVPSLPPTQEVEEEQSPIRSPQMAPKPIVESKYSPRQTRRATPPPIGSPAYGMVSPPKRSASNYTPLSPASMPHREVNFAPPPRSQTQSPGALHGNRPGPKPADPIPRPSSVQGASSPREVQHTDASRPLIRARGMSQHLNLVPPTDGRELDPLKRWRGSPVFSWGVGGTFVTSFPTDVPRYGITSALPTIVRSPGEVKIKHIKDIQPLEERLAKFPGPLKGKSKKKETLAWLSAGIETLERNLPNVSFQQSVSHEEKRAIERILLWKILRVFIENDGLLEGNPTVDKAVREVISPGLDTDNPELASALSVGADLTGISSPVTGMQADAVDATAIEQIRRFLLSGDREKAVWAAVDKRLWGHAMLISNTMKSPELYKQVAQEFIKKEVNYPGHGNESIAALYGVLSGNFEESVDELVPVHARAGLQLMSPSASVGASKDGLAGLDKWRETLGLILSNRSFSDAQALRSLGNLLSGYGRAEAAHICYIFARNCAIFGGLDDPNANFVLVGADHRRQADQFAKETEALQLSEVYEYGLSLAGGSTAVQSSPHLAAYKFQHAMTLAEYGLRDKALQYCEGIYNSITAQTKRSPYYHPTLESAVDDLMRRLKQAPREESSSWIPKPRMDQVSTNMWSRFNKFVAGDDEDNAAKGASGEVGAESGPFSRLGAGTPTISRSPSVSNFDIYGNSLSPTASTVPATKAGSRYAPGAPQAQAGNPYEPAPRSSMERTSGEITRSSYELPRRGSGMQSAPSYGNESHQTPNSNYQPVAPGSAQTSPYMPPTGMGISFPGYDPYGGSQQNSLSQPAAESKPETQPNGVDSSQGYQAPSYGYAPSMNTFEAPDAGGYESSSFQPSSFEPPSYMPGPADEGDSPNETKPKKKSFFDDDEDDIPSLRPQEKSKADKDRENEEMVRKVAEEEAKRTAEAKAAKKGWGFGGWFGGGSKKEQADLANANKPIKAKLGEASSFVYDPELKRWVNKKSGAENTPAKTATPPPPRSVSGTPPPPMGPPSSAPPPSMGGLSVPPAGPARLSPSPAILNKAVSHDNLQAPGGGISMRRSVSNQSTSSAPGGPVLNGPPPSRPGTSLSTASSIDDLLSAAGPRKGGKKTRKSGRYVDVMAK